MIKKITVILLLGIMTQMAMGQLDADRVTTPALSVRAAVWGQVNRPGQFFLSGSPDLFELISAAGGPTAGADLNRIIVISERDATRRHINLHRLACSGQPFFIATGDVVIVPESFWSKFRNGLPVITAAAAVANVAITAILLAQR